MSQWGSCQGIKRTTTGFALIALAVVLTTTFTNIFAMAMLSARMSRKVLFQTLIELTGLMGRLTKYRAQNFPLATTERRTHLKKSTKVGIVHHTLQPQKTEDWSSVEDRQLFCRTEPDPLVSTICPVWRSTAKVI